MNKREIYQYCKIWYGQAPNYNYPNQRSLDSEGQKNTYKASRGWTFQYCKMPHSWMKFKRKRKNIGIKIPNTNTSVIWHVIQEDRNKFLNGQQNSSSKHRENSPVTKTTPGNHPRPHWGGWPREKKSKFQIRPYQKIFFDVKNSILLYKSLVRQLLVWSDFN